MTEQVTRIIRRAKDCHRSMPWEFGKMSDDPGLHGFPYDTGWLLWIISDHEAYWIHTKTDKVVASSRNY